MFCAPWYEHDLNVSTAAKEHIFCDVPKISSPDCTHNLIKHSGNLYTTDKMHSRNVLATSGEWFIQTFYNYQHNWTVFALWELAQSQFWFAWMALYCEMSVKWPKCSCWRRNEHLQSIPSVILMSVALKQGQYKYGLLFSCSFVHLHLNYLADTLMQSDLQVVDWTKADKKTQSQS